MTSPLGSQRLGSSSRNRTAVYALAAVLLVATARFATAALLLGSLQVEGLEAPLAVPASPPPRFSWRADAARQLSYRIVVVVAAAAAADSGAPPLWDSGLVNTSASSLIACGAPLPADADLAWTVSLQLEGVGAVSATGVFSTAPDATALAAGAWLGGADTLRTSFALSPAPVLRARLHATAAGCLHAYVNGARVSAELTPGFAHAPSARMPFATYDVRALLAPGAENVVAMRIGSCKMGTYGQYCKGTASQCNAGWALLSVEQGGGNVTVLATSGATWRGTNTSVVRQHLYDGELFDARLEQEGWSAPGFLNASSWPAAAERDVSELLGPLVPARARPVLRGEPMAAASVAAVAGGFVFDVGPLLNMAGFCRLDLAPPPGEAPVAAGRGVSLLHAEGLYLDGSIWNWYLTHPGCSMDCAYSTPAGCPVNCAAMNHSYITRGGGREIFEPPHFSYFGFRWVQLVGWPCEWSAPALVDPRILLNLAHPLFLTSALFPQTLPRRPPRR